MTMLTVLAFLAAFAGLSLAAGSHLRARRAEHTGREQRARAEGLAEQAHVAGQYLAYLANSALPAAAAAAQVRSPHQPDLALPPQLIGTPTAGVLAAVARQATGLIAATGQAAHAAAESQTAAVHRAADDRVAQARQEALDVARAAVRAFASSTVQRASKLSTRISDGVRRHVSDEAYATLVQIDHLAQQMLLTASGYAVLAGDKLSRRHPATSVSEIVRAAMGRVEGFQRVQHADLDSFAVDSRAVEAVIHTLAILLDNALRYSPPNATVHVSVEHGNDAVFLLVDDAGLRMEDERLNLARQVMSSTRRGDITNLGAYPQTGLRVAAVLAAEYGYRVEVTAPNVYGGTRAFLVLPRILLTAPPAPVSPSAATQAAARQLGPASPPAAAALTASGLTMRRPAAGPTGPGRSTAPTDPVAPGRPDVAAAWMAGTRRGRQTPAAPSPDEGH
ncbi:ATP-binding protein [Streptomyces sp. NPDC047999]|uniref:ATP-binding protein n=1 Tax=Streptomyces sp. NPDC047999 TaxID=3365497 RepID=UPI0037119FED